jgi:hypothetical protein
MHDGIYRYLEHGLQPGNFLIAVLCNDLYSACQNADITNLSFLGRYGVLLNALPLACWGSEEKVNAWIEKGGLNGRQS